MTHHALSMGSRLPGARPGPPPVPTQVASGPPTPNATRWPSSCHGISPTGRLDQAEFKARLDRAMGAVTRGDLDGLFDDLPRLADDPEPPRPRRRLLFPPGRVRRSWSAVAARVHRLGGARAVAAGPGGRDVLVAPDPPPSGGRRALPRTTVSIAPSLRTAGIGRRGRRHGATYATVQHRSAHHAGEYRQGESFDDHTRSDARHRPGLSETPAARAVDLVKTYGKGDAIVHALDGINVEFERGRFTAVMGPSGSGKSTLMHCMAGLDTPTSGRTFVGDQEIGLLDDAGLTQMRRDRIGFVFQSFNLVPTLTAGENITLPADLAGQRWTRPGSTTWSASWDRGPSGPPPERDVGRPAAACGLRPGPHQPARPDLRRRADRQPRLERLGRDARASSGAR